MKLINNFKVHWPREPIPQSGEAWGKEMHEIKWSCSVPSISPSKSKKRIFILIGNESMSSLTADTVSHNNKKYFCGKWKCSLNVNNAFIFCPDWFVWIVFKQQCPWLNCLSQENHRNQVTYGLVIYTSVSLYTEFHFRDSSGKTYWWLAEKSLQNKFQILSIFPLHIVYFSHK